MSPHVPVIPAQAEIAERSLLRGVPDLEKQKQRSQLRSTASHLSPSALPKDR